MLIGQVSQKYGVSIETLRYYDRIGLLVPKRMNKNRYYSEEDITKLKYMLQMKNLMFSLEEIKRILAIDEKIDEGLLNQNLDLRDVESLYDDIAIKYQEVLEKEREFLKVKRNLANLLKKIDAFKEGGTSNE